MKKFSSSVLISFILFAVTTFGGFAQLRDSSNTAEISVWASKWSKVRGIVHYSDWMEFKAKTIDILPGFSPAPQSSFSRYGSNPDLKRKATGFFYVEKISNRWWIIDPEGYAGINAGVNGVRPGKSDRNINALQTGLHLKTLYLY